MVCFEFRVLVIVVYLLFVNWHLPACRLAGCLICLFYFHPFQNSFVLFPQPRHGFVPEHPQLH